MMIFRLRWDPNRIISWAHFVRRPIKESQLVKCCFLGSPLTWKDIIYHQVWIKSNCKQKISFNIPSYAHEELKFQWYCNVFLDWRLHVFRPKWFFHFRVNQSTWSSRKCLVFHSWKNKIKFVKSYVIWKKISFFFFFKIYLGDPLEAESKQLPAKLNPAGRGNNGSWAVPSLVLPKLISNFTFRVETWGKRDLPSSWVLGKVNALPKKKLVKIIEI